MNNADFNRYQDAQTRIRSIIKTAVQHQQRPSNVMWREVWEIIAGIYQHNKRTPQHLGASLRQYAEGYFDALATDQTVFLYNVNGQFYKLGLSCQKDLPFPCWDELPRSMWDKLGEYGGIYWRKTLKPYQTKEKH